MNYVPWPGAARLACALLLVSSGLPRKSISDKLGGWLFGGYSTPPTSNNPSTAVEIDCPGVDVRQGASTLAITRRAPKPGR